MPSPIHDDPKRVPARVVILGTGGTIAGTAATAVDNVGYRAADLTVQALVDAVPALAGAALQVEQVAQVDSKDMDHVVWQRLARRADAHLSQPGVVGLVITHGTDTLEETAWFLQRVLAPVKPVVLTAAMRPATSLQADGPQNLLDAVTLAREPGARGVLAVVAGNVYLSADLRKAHSYRLDAFSSGDAGLLGRIEEGRLRRFRPWPESAALGLSRIARDPAQWPWVEVVQNHANADGRVVDALVAAGAHGIVLAGTGNGTLSSALHAAALRARSAGLMVIRASRCAAGPVIDADDEDLPHAGALSPVQARVELLLQGLS